jgi:hypothetical protein
MRVDQCFKSINWREVCGCVTWRERDLRANLRRLPEERAPLAAKRVQCARANEALQRAERELGASCDVFE